MTKKTVLLAEDSSDTRELLQWLLEAENFSVIPAEDGERAWQLAREFSPDLVITDINMPRMNGIDLIRHLKADARLQSIPVVALTAYSGGSYMDDARMAGATMALAKPIEFDTFIKVLQDLAAHRRSMSVASPDRAM